MPSPLTARALALVWAGLLCAGCDSLSESGTATFTGVVLDAGTDEPVEGATVAISGAGASTTTDAEGRYTLSVEADSSGQPFTFAVEAEDYEEATFTARADVDEAVTVPNVELDPLGDGGGPVEPGGPPASITLSGRSSEAIGVTGAGADETATLTFVLLDGRGQPVGEGVGVRFAIGSGPGGGERLEPTSDSTDANGEVEVTLTSGARAGTVQIVASATANGQLLQSLPVTVVITGGLPSGPNFSVAPERLNFAGYNVFGLTNPITAYVGDRYNNPVQPGTAVYFTSDGGIIPGSGVTSAAGTTTVALLSAAPLPSNPFSCGAIPTAPNGYAVVRARTSDQDQQPIEATTTVLFSGVAFVAFTELPSSPFGGYGFEVSDQFGHPLAPGTQVTVTADGDNIRATGDASFTLGDHLCPGPGRTQFRFSVGIADNEPGAPPPVLRTITISVDGPNGAVRLTLTVEPGLGPDPARARLERLRGPAL